MAASLLFLPEVFGLKPYKNLVFGRANVTLSPKPEPAPHGSLTYKNNVFGRASG
jgi:hypothetical protein